MNSEGFGLETKSSGMSIFLSFFYPGLGHLYLGKIGRGVVMLIVTLILYGGTWLLFDASITGGRFHQTLYNSMVSRYEQEPGADRSAAHDRAWTELQDVRNENARYGFGGLGFGIASFSWWIWAMVSARKLCDMHNREVFTKVSGVAR